MTTRDRASAARAIWTNAAISLPANALFFAIGSALLAFYAAHPERLDPTMPNDAVFPLFIARELPVGLAGIVMAGVFAAAQSTISSSLNSIATCYVTDFHRRLRPASTDAACLRIARIVTVLVGIVGTAAALVLATANVRSVYNVFLEILSLFGGTLAGLFVLGIFSRRASGSGAVSGAVASMAAVVTAKVLWSPSFFVFAPLGMTVLVASGYVASFVVPSRPKDLTGLTIYTRRA
jgi:Na+/proline symporter